MPDKPIPIINSMMDRVRKIIKRKYYIHCISSNNEYAQLNIGLREETFKLAVFKYCTEHPQFATMAYKAVLEIIRDQEGAIS